MASPVIEQAEQQSWRIMSTWPLGRTFVYIVTEVNLDVNQRQRLF